MAVSPPKPSAATAAGTLAFEQFGGVSETSVPNTPVDQLDAGARSLLQSRDGSIRTRPQPPGASSNAAKKLMAPTLPDALDADALTAALGAQPAFRSHTLSRFRATHAALSVFTPRTAEVAELIRLNDRVVQDLESGDMRRASESINSLFAWEPTGNTASDRNAANVVQRTLASLVDRMRISGRRGYAPVSVRYAEHLRAYHAVNGDKGVGPEDPGFGGQLRNVAYDIAYRIPWDWDRSVISSFQEQISAPPEVRAEFDLERQNLSSPHDVVKLAARLAAAYAHDTDGWLCRHAAEVTRELLAEVGFDANIETIYEPFLHAYL
ncbi:MAG: hypothetical protein AAF658_19045, partial [Myxococcota bacterium]